MPSAAILAGGRGTRFGGRDKSALIVGGRSIADRQLAELSTLTDDLIIVGARIPASAAARAVHDRVAGLGPLGGLEAALAAARHEEVVVVACDMPYVSARFLRSLMELLAGADAVVPRTNGGYHPLCAVYTRACHAAVVRRLEAGKLAVVGLLDDVRVRVVEPDDLAAFDCRRELANVNTPAELESLEALLGHEP